MAHNKQVHGFCENGCKVQVYSKKESDAVADNLKVLNVKLNHTIPTSAYQNVSEPTLKKKFYADVPCTKSKVSMNCDITPADSVEDAGLLTYAEPMEGKVRCYFMEEPAEAYTVEAIELTPVVSSVEVDVKEFLAGDVYAN